MYVADLPRFLCYVNGEGKDAAIVNSKQEILRFISDQWMGTEPDPFDDEWEDIFEDLRPEPWCWGDGTQELKWEFETGYLSVELLSDHWDESWSW